MPRAVRGVLIECDPSVKAIILKYDEERHDYIVEDLDDDRHLVIKESQLQNLKLRLGRELDEKFKPSLLDDALLHTTIGQLAGHVHAYWRCGRKQVLGHLMAALKTTGELRLGWCSYIKNLYCGPTCGVSTPGSGHGFLVLQQ
ncbi:transcription factor TFIIH complex subunit Tfb5-domain-containing protein [Aspergillus spinulosporus]